MSTFDGCVPEFPDIRIDFFRRQTYAQPPLACFLSHVHSDHLAGLDSLLSPFVYCSAATREILLRLERYPCRINYANGVLEARQQTYRHLRKVLKPLPLEAPTRLELRPGQYIQVTLFNANHCPGAVMFLIEDDAHAILYTGDVRSEPWFVNSLGRNPNLIEYTSGIRRLDKIYLDTSFTQDVAFQTKAEGLAELVRKVKQYPEDTVFHFQAWTYGYEDVWIALSKALKTHVHVDDYKLKIYRALTTRTTDDPFGPESHLSPEAPALTGFLCGNAIQPGCLTANERVRLHSCEKGNMCETASHPDVIKIQPIIAHLPGGDHIPEVGVGGGGDDLEREGELDAAFLRDLDGLFDRLQSSDEIHAEVWQVIQTTVSQAAVSGRGLALKLEASSCVGDLSTTIQSAIKAMAQRFSNSTVRTPRSNLNASELPRVIRFPYSRHSSYHELCHLVEIFRPKDIWPCTVDIDQWLKSGTTIRSLFEQYCSGDTFAHDLRMEEYAERTSHCAGHTGSEAIHTQQSASSLGASPSFSPVVEPLSDLPPNEAQVTLIDLPQPCADPGNELPFGATDQPADEEQGPPTSVDVHETAGAQSRPSKRTLQAFLVEQENEPSLGDSQETDCSFISSISTRHSITRWQAYYQTLSNARGDDWQPVSLISTNGEHSRLEDEL